MNIWACINILEVVRPNLMASEKLASSALVKPAIMASSSFVHLAVDAGDLDPVVPDGFLRLLMKVSEVGTNGLGRELRFTW